MYICLVFQGRCGSSWQWENSSIIKSDHCESCLHRNQRNEHKFQRGETCRGELIRCPLMATFTDQKLCVWTCLKRGRMEFSGKMEVSQWEETRILHEQGSVRKKTWLAASITLWCPWQYCDREAQRTSKCYLHFVSLSKWWQQGCTTFMKILGVIYLWAGFLKVIYQ